MGELDADVEVEPRVDVVLAPELVELLGDAGAGGVLVGGDELGVGLGLGEAGVGVGEGWGGGVGVVLGVGVGVGVGVVGVLGVAGGLLGVVGGGGEGGFVGEVGEGGVTSVGGVAVGVDGVGVGELAQEGSGTGGGLAVGEAGFGCGAGGTHLSTGVWPTTTAANRTDATTTIIGRKRRTIMAIEGRLGYRYISSVMRPLTVRHS